MNIVLIKPKNRDNLATIIRSGQNFDLRTVFVIGGFIESKYKGNIHKFNHQMDTQNGLSNITLIYFSTLEEFLNHLPAQTILILIEMLNESVELKNFEHPENATYIFGRETTGIEKKDISLIVKYISKLNSNIPKEHLDKVKTVSLNRVKITTPHSLNLGVCASIVMYDRICKK